MRLILTQPQLAAFDTEGNAAAVDALLAPLRGTLATDDIVLLPEHIAFDADAKGYEDAVAARARSLGCAVVGGSQHQDRGEVRVNTGVVADASGALVGRYDKLRPYADERKHVAPGELFGECRIGDLQVLILICADFWFSDLFTRCTVLPDLVLVPALSVTRKDTPDYSRDLWRHLAVTRAYEFGVYVGISDWAYPSRLPSLFASGVGGMADPTGLDPNRFFQPTGVAGLQVVDIDMDALRRFRDDRRARGFFWQPR